MLLLLHALASAHIFPNPIMHLTERNFGRLVDGRRNESVFLVMFHGDRCPACRAAYPKFTAAARSLTGAVSFGHVVCRESPSLSDRFGIRAIPTFLVFHPRGVSRYDSLWRTESGIANAALQRLPDLSANATDAWISAQPRAAVLATRTGAANGQWRAVCARYSAFGNVSIGVRRDPSAGSGRVLLFARGRAAGSCSARLPYAELAAQIDAALETREL